MDSYKKYEPFDFLQDENFIKWLKNPEVDDENNAFWKNWIKENPGKSNDIETARLMFETITEKNEEPKGIKKKVWDKLQTSIIQDLHTTNKKLKIESRNRFKTILRVAATIALIISIGSAFYFLSYLPKKQNALVSIENQRSKPTPVLMADGSSIILYPNSSIKYPKNFDNSYREIDVEGKIFIEVAKNSEKPFILASNRIVTKVLGTSFLVEDRADISNASVSVVEGTVAVYSKQENKKAIKKGDAGGEIVVGGEALQFNEQENTFIRQDFKEHISSTFNFIDVPVLEVFNVLEEFYGIKINVNRQLLINCSINASLVGMPFQKKIDIISKALNYEYRFENNTVFLEGEGCQ